MPIQEKLADVFETVKSVGFGEREVDKQVVEADAKLRKDPASLDKSSGKTLILLDVLQMFSLEKGLVGLTKALDQLEAHYPQASLTTRKQTELETITNELTRQANKFQSELGGDAALTHQIGLLIKDKKWREASQTIHDSILAAKDAGDIKDSHYQVMQEALNVVESDRKPEISTKSVEIREKKVELLRGGAESVEETLARADKLDTGVTRAYVGVLRAKTPLPEDVDEVFKVDAGFDNVATRSFIKGVDKLHPDISRADAKRLAIFQDEVEEDLDKLINDGIDLVTWSHGDTDKQRVIREAHATVSHILYVDKTTPLGMSAQDKKYLREVQRSTSAARRAWMEELIQEGEAAHKVEGRSPDDLREAAMRMGGIDQLTALGNAQNYIEWSKNQRMHGDPSGRWGIEDDLGQGEDSVQERLGRLKTEGKLKEQGGQIVWNGTADEFFDVMSELARDVSAIVPEVNQIPFSRAPKARLYQMLMESEAPPALRGDLAWAKDAVFRLYTMGYVKEALWKNGGAVEPFTKAALALLGQGGDESVYSSLFHFHETVRARSGEGELPVDILKIDLRDMLDFSEQYSRLKQGKRSWLNAISAGTLNESGDASSKPARKEFFLEYMKSVLDQQLDRGEIEPEEHARKLSAIGNDANSERYNKIFDVYGEYYTNLVKVLQSIHLRYGEVAVNQAIDGGSFDFCSPPGGEAPYKLHKKSVFKFVARYVPTQKFAQFLDGKVDMGMVSTPAYARKETLPHFVLEHSNTAANPGADEYFFKHETSADKKKFAKQFVAFWKPAMFDSDDNPGKEYRDTDDLRMIADTQEIALAQLNTWDRSKLEFVNHIDYEMLSNAAFGVENKGKLDFNTIFAAKGITDPKEKFRYMITNYGYRYLEWNGLRSKRIGDFYGKYLPENFAGVYKAAIALGQNATSDEAIFEAAKHIDAFSGATNFIGDIDKVVEELNKWRLGGIRMPKTKGGSNWLGVDQKGEKASIDMHGDFESSLKGLLPGNLKRTSYAEYLIRHRDPEWMRPFLWEAAFQGGQLSPELFEKRMKDYKGEMYFGPKIGKTGFRLGYILPVFLARGWFVDRWHLDADDFWWITSKSNKKIWDEVKKAFGIK